MFALESEIQSETMDIENTREYHCKPFTLTKNGSWLKLYMLSI